MSHFKSFNPRKVLLCWVWTLLPQLVGQKWLPVRPNVAHGLPVDHQLFYTLALLCSSCAGETLRLSCVIGSAWTDNPTWSRLDSRRNVVNVLLTEQPQAMFVCYRLIWEGKYTYTCTWNTILKACTSYFISTFLWVRVFLHAYLLQPI